MLMAPAVFELGDDVSRSQLLTFLRMLRRLTVLHDTRVTIDFDETTRMESAGTLLFLSEVHRILAIGRDRKRRLIKCRRMSNPKVAQVLHQIGFFGAIGRKSKIQPTESDVIHWRVVVAGTGTEGQKASELIESFRDRLPPSLSSPMYAGLVEAMTNCRQHAYLHKRRDGLGLQGKGEWWLFAQERDGLLNVVICDLGIGIPSSLPLTQDQSLIADLLAKAGLAITVGYTDADLVHAATEVGRSRTRNPHRGKGLKDVVDVINTAGSGHLVIHSNRGRYSYYIKDGTPTRARKNYRHSILGTVIQWAVPIVESTHG